MQLAQKSKPGAATRNPQRSRERILEAALKEFAAKGFAGARVDAIARGAGINKRMLYHYFGDKAGLFREVLRRKMETRAAWLAAAPEDPAESLAYWFQLACRDREWIRLLEWEALQWDEHQVMDENRRREAAECAVKRLRSRQAKRLIGSHFNPGQLLLSLMALTAYPLAFPQLSRLVTGLSVSDPEFQRQRGQFLRQFAAALQTISEAQSGSSAQDGPQNDGK